MTEILAICAGLATLAGGAAVLLKVLSSLKKLGNFVDDWNGEPDRPGVPGRPGVMQRLRNIEAELQNNHGSSLRDVADRVESGLNELRDNFSEHIKQTEISFKAQALD
ncbi:hypothetical protein [Sphaerisporangium rhizosphaerae]|uniref:Uncharacterized protein n=1 Tax=Sphaerisporangium rhizosphaerae TaxID=2269375 RepID=A0ABW2NXG9_9ACTN